MSTSASTSSAPSSMILKTRVRLVLWMQCSPYCDHSPDWLSMPSSASIRAWLGTIRSKQFLLIQAQSDVEEAEQDSASDTFALSTSTATAELNADMLLSLMIGLSWASRRPAPRTDFSRGHVSGSALWCPLSWLVLSFESKSHTACDSRPWPRARESTLSNWKWRRPSVDWACQLWSSRELSNLGSASPSKHSPSWHVEEHGLWCFGDDSESLAFVTATWIKLASWVSNGGAGHP